LLKVGEEVILIGDNFQVPNVGIAGKVTQISPGGYVRVDWIDDRHGWFSPYQATKWICRRANGRTSGI
jgi:hypothetical protein